MTTTTLPNTGAIVPVPQQRRGPAYASDLVTAFENYDEHDHTTGKGKPISVAALNIDGDVDFKAIEGHHINNLGALNMRQVTNTILALSLYTDGEDLFWRDGSGDPIQLTLLHNVNESASGSITGLGVGSSGVSYTPGSLFYTFLDQEGDEAKIKQGVPSIFKKNDSMASREMILDFVAEDADGASFTKTFNPVSAEVVDQGTKELDFTHSTSPGSVTSGHSKIFFDNSDNLPKFQNESGTVTTFGAGGAAENAKTANFATGGDLDTITLSSFINAGAGTFSVETDAPIRGNESAHYEGYVLSSTLTYATDIAIPRGYRNSTVKVSFKYTGGGNIKLEVIDRTGDTDVSVVNTTVLAIPQSLQDGTVEPVYNDFLADVFIPNTVEKVRLRWVGTGDNPQTDDDTPVDIPFIFDDIVVTPIGETTLPVTTYTLSGDSNTFSIDKYSNSNDAPESPSNTGTTDKTVTLTEDTDYSVGGDWVESVTIRTTGTAGTLGTSDGFTSSTYTITSNANIFDETNLPVVEIMGRNFVTENEAGTIGDFERSSVSFSSNKLVIVYSNSTSGRGLITTPSITEFGINVTKTAGFGPATLVPQTAATSVSYEQSINQINSKLEYTADYVINSGDISISEVTNQQRNGVAFTWINAVNDNADTGQIDFSFDTAETGFTVIPEINMIPSNSSGATQGWIANSSTSQFRYNGQSLVNGNVSMITQSGRIVVKPSGADVPADTLLPTGAYILTPAFPVGSIVDSVLTEPVFNQNTQGSWVLCDGRDISSSTLAELTSVNYAPNFSGRYAGMSGIAGGATIQVDTFGNFSNGDTITIGNVVLTASDTTNANNVFQYVTSNDATATNIAAAYNNTKEVQFSTATVSTNTVTIPSGISVLSTTSTDAITFPGLSAKLLNAVQASEVKSSDVPLTDPGHTHTFTASVGSKQRTGSFSDYGTAPEGSTTASATTGITITAGDETRPATYVVNKFIKIGD